MTRGVLVLLSGGIDSALVLDKAVDNTHTVHTLHVTYGQQTAEVERRNAAKQASHHNTTHHTVDLSDVVGQYAAGVADGEASFNDQRQPDGRSTGYVPMRNLTLLSIGAGFADTHDLGAVSYGAQGGDRDDYPDCRPAFVDAAQEAVNQSLASDDVIDIHVPLMDHTKTEVIQQATRRDVPLEWTYSCYSATDPDDPEPCGHCPACLERTDAFDAAGVSDPALE